MNRLWVILLTIVVCQGVAASTLPDSLLTTDAVYRYMFVDPGKSRGIIRTMRERKMLPEWKLDLADGNLCFSKCLFNKALSFYTKSYESEAVQSNDSIKMVLLTRMIQVYDIQYEEKNLPRYTHELYELAMSRHDTVYAAMALFMDGKRAHYQGNRQKGYQHCKEAVRMIQGAPGFWRKNNVLRAFYGFLAKMCYDDKNYDEALKYSEAEEKASYLPHNPEILLHQERNLYRVYAIRSNILMAMGRQKEADSAYERCVALPVADPFIIRDIVLYLSKRHRYQEIIPYLYQVNRILTEDGDTLSRNKVLLYYDAGDAFAGLRQYDSASHYYAMAARLSEKIHSIHSRQLKESVSESIELERRVARQERIQLYIYSGIVLIIIASLLYFFWMNRTRRTNKLMARLIHSMMNYRYETLYGQGGEPDGMEDNNLKKLKDDPMWQLFHEADKQVVKKELFRDPDFGRDELMRVMGVSKETLAEIIHRFTGTNVPGYINTKRVEFAIQLIKMHPEYTLSAISEACGIKSPATFIRHFKNIYGMTPSEYRQHIEEENFTPPVLAPGKVKSPKLTK